MAKPLMHMRNIADVDDCAVCELFTGISFNWFENRPGCRYVRTM